MLCLHVLPNMCTMCIKCGKDVVTVKAEADDSQFLTDQARSRFMVTVLFQVDVPGADYRLTVSKMTLVSDIHHIGCDHLPIQRINGIIECLLIHRQGDKRVWLFFL